MKVVMIFDGLLTGGITKVGATYANLLINSGYEVSIINLNPKEDNMIYAFDKRCNQYKFFLPRYAIYQRFSPLTVYGLYGIIIYLILATNSYLIMNVCKLLCRIKLYKQNNPDVIIAFSGHYNDLGFVANDFFKSRCKIAWLHGAEIEYKVNSEGFFALYRKIKNLVCLSEFGDELCRKFNSKNKIEKTLIYNPVNIKKENLNQVKIEELKKIYGEYVLMVGRLGIDKDQVTAIKAIQYVNEKYNLQLKLILVGDGERRKELEELVDSLNMHNIVIFVGQCSDVENYYASANIFVHSSPLEGLPTVLLEAMAFSLPIAATDSIPGVREILGNDKYGLLSPVFDYIALGENIYKLYNNKELRCNLTNNALNRLKDFDSYKSLKKLENLFNKILEKREIKD